MSDLNELIARNAVMAFNAGYNEGNRKMQAELDATVSSLDWAEAVRINEDAWNEIQSAYVLKRALLTLIAQYKAEGYMAATLDKFAMLVENGHDGWNYGEEREE